MKEDAVKRAVKKILDDHGVYWFMPPGMGLGRAGIPDIVCCYKGRFFAFECKGDGGKPTALQSREIEKIEAAGGMAYIIDPTNIAVVTSLLQLIDRTVWE